MRETSECAGATFVTFLASRFWLVDTQHQHSLPIFRQTRHWICLFNTLVGILSCLKGSLTGQYFKRFLNRMTATASRRHVLQCRAHPLDCRTTTRILGVLNVTPDSFSDGGKYMAVEDAVARALAMRDAGADVIDIGGESTRPSGREYGEGAAKVARQEEIDRVVPVVERLHEEDPELLLSVDTYKPEVAEAALEAGAHIINDITGLRIHPETADVAAAHGAPLIVMHSLGRPGAMPHGQTYDDLMQAVHDGLAQAVERAVEAGVQDIVVDPGFGFAKSHADNLRLINALDTLTALERPILVGVSRKSSIGAALSTPASPVPVDKRLHGSIAATVLAVQQGARLVRTHDVAATAQALRVADAVRHPDRLSSD